MIDGVGKEVDELTEEEKKTYMDIDFDMAAYQADVGTNLLTEDTKVSLIFIIWSLFIANVGHLKAVLIILPILAIFQISASFGESFL